MIGKTLGRYRIDAQIGAGGMGVVYRAQDTELHRPVALKLLSEENISSAAARERLLSEARSASALNHPNISTIYEVGQAEGVCFLAMEIVEGRPLNEMVPSEGLSADALLNYAVQIASGVAHAHDRGVVHRDLKSANVMITPEGRAKVLDFGLALRLGAEELNEVTRSQQLPENRAITGTLLYMAPELFRGQPADARSDIWSLGVLLYEMAAGKMPFGGATGYELTAAILRETPAPLPPKISAGLRGMIDRCLAKEPAQRYQRGSELRAALEALSSERRSGEPAPAPRPHFAEEKPAGSRAEFSLAARLPWLRIAVRISFLALAVIVSGTILWQPWKSTESPSSQVAVGTKSGPPAEVMAPDDAAAASARRAPDITPGAAFRIRKLSANAEANKLLQRAMLFTRFQNDPLRARPMLERALQLDPKFAEARVNYALTFLIAVEGGISNDSGDLYRAEQELRRALADDPGLLRGHNLLGAVHFFQGRFDLALEENKKAEQLYPGEVAGLNWKIIYSQFEGRAEEAIRIARELIAAEPLFWPPRYRLGELLREQGKIAESVRMYEEVLEQDAQNSGALHSLARAYMDSGDLARARKTLDRIRPQDKSNFRVRIVEAQYHALAGHRAQALKELDEQTLKYGDLNPFATLHVAEVYAVLGEKEKAIDWLDRAMRKGDGRSDWIRRSPLLKNIREHPRFHQIVDSMEFRRQQRAAEKN
jgi:serine/threonine protein kinase/lipopolysaccharide biosynthesis regulator YciM